MTGAASCVLEARDLGYRASDGARLVDGISVKIRSGDIVALSGPNGAGKTTLLRLFAGLIAPTTGSVTLFGDPIQRLSARERARRVAVAGQHDSPDWRLRVEEYVALGRIPHGRNQDVRDHGMRDRRDMIEHAIRETGLAPLRDARLGRLSGGELQRAIIARALCQEPEILFLDEPTNHLDPRAKRDLLAMVAGLGVTTVVVMHELTLIPGFANRVILLNDGRQIAAGDTEDTLTGDAVRAVFGVDYLLVEHPEERRMLPILDVGIDRRPPTSSQGSNERNVP
jgi:iron complex transport system ATP-binding protein